MLPHRRGTAVAAPDGQGVHLAAGTAAAAANKKVAVILFNFSDDASQPYTPASARGVAFDSPNAVAKFFEEESRGAVTVTGDVFGWYTIADSKTTCSNPFAWATHARNAATAAGVDLSSYTNFVYAFPFTSSCGGWAGLGAMPGSESWNNGSFSLRVVAHELGHNFGVHHASSLSCTSGGGRVSLSSSCSSAEYGDPFTVMGGSNSAHDHAFHLGQFGWLPAGEVRTVGPGGPFGLGSILDGPAGSDRLLSINRGNGTWFYLDLRSTHGPYFDTFAAGSPAVTGVTVRNLAERPQPELLRGPDPAGRYHAGDGHVLRRTTGCRPEPDRSGLRAPGSRLTVNAGSATVGVTDVVAPGAPAPFTRRPPTRRRSA